MDTNENKGRHLRPADRRMQQESLLQGRFLTSWTNNRPSWFRFILLPVWIVEATGGETVAALSGRDERRLRRGQRRRHKCFTYLRLFSQILLAAGQLDRAADGGGGAGGSGVPPNLH